MDVKANLRMTFPGGVHPPEHKITNDCPIKACSPGKIIAIPLSQHIGAVCKPLVRKGNTVQAGQKIGDVDAFVSAPVHSPVTGKVKDIALYAHPSQARAEAIIIEPLENIPAKHNIPEISADFSEKDYSVDKICEAVREAGIVGMGGAGFPTRVKIEPNPRLPKKTMILNACECEPYITCDYRLMLERAYAVIAGVKLARKAAGCSEVFMAIEDNKPNAIESLNQALEKTGDSEDISVVPVKTKYPQGGERQLIKSVMGKNVPTGGIPPAIGVLVLNVATATAIAEAVVHKQALTHRVVTVTGQAIAEPGNYYVPIGTAVNDLLDYAGGVTQKSAKVVMGGPMMGFAIADLSTPITKTSGAITVLTKEQIGRAKYKRRQTPCIRCGKCITACPENLNPTKIAHAVKNNNLDLAKSYYISACIECGCCSYVCPANLEITGDIKTGKVLLARAKKKIPK
jgi:electron transport complex protein RnfC